MYQHTLKSNKGSRKKPHIRYGRGNGSGRGTFSGRGSKGQKSRSGAKSRPGFEGGQTPLIRQLPKVRGFNNPNRTPYQIVNVSALNVFDDGATIDAVALYTKHLATRKNKPIKILGDGDLTKKLTVVADAVSALAKEKIEKIGGTIETMQKKKPPTVEL